MTSIIELISKLAKQYPFIFKYSGKLTYNQKMTCIHRTHLTLKFSVQTVTVVRCGKMIQKELHDLITVCTGDWRCWQCSLTLHQEME